MDKVDEGYKQAGAGLAPQLSMRAYHVLALMKLRQYGAAAEELALLGSLNAPHYRYEAHPGMYPGQRGAVGESSTSRHCEWEGTMLLLQLFDTEV